MVSIVLSSICHEVMGPEAMIFVFWKMSFKPTFSLPSFTFIKRLSSSSLLSAIRVVSSAYLRLFMFLLAILIPARALSSPAFHIMYSEYNLNKQGDNMQPWHNPFPIWNQSVVPYPVLTVASWPAYRFLRKQVRWSHLLKNFPQLIVIHTVKGFGIVNKAEVDVFLELPCFFDDPANVDILISGSSAFPKSNLNILKFTVHIPLKPHLENLEDYFASMRNECSCAVVWTFFGIAFLWDWNETDIFQCCGHWWVFQICWHIDCSTLRASSFKIWNGSTGIPSPTLALFVVMLPKAHLTSHSRISGFRWVITLSWFFCVFLPTLLNIFHFC